VALKDMAEIGGASEESFVGWLVAHAGSDCMGRWQDGTPVAVAHRTSVWLMCTAETLK